MSTTQTQISTAVSYEREKCVHCGQSAFSDVSGISLGLEYCDRCDFPCCSDCSDADFDFVGDPGSYKCTSWTCSKGKKCEEVSQ